MCPICSNNHFSFPIKGYKKCLKCEALSVISFPHAPEVAKVTEESSEGIISGQREVLIENDYLERFNRFKNYLKKNSNLLDFGCGSGLFVKFLLSKGYKAWGFDKSRRLSSYLGKLDIPIFKNIHQIQNNHFDVITSFDV